MQSSDANIILVPGLGNSGPKHWQTLWEQRSSSVRRAELGGWSRFGHINADSGIGDWPYGLYLLADLLRPENPGENREAAERIAQYHRRRQDNASLFEEGTSSP